MEEFIDDAVACSIERATSRLNGGSTYKNAIIQSTTTGVVRVLAYPATSASARSRHPLGIWAQAVNLDRPARSAGAARVDFERGSDPSIATPRSGNALDGRDAAEASASHLTASDEVVAGKAEETIYTDSCK